MSQFVKITVQGEPEKEIEAKTSVAAVVPSADKAGHPVLGAIVNNMVVPLVTPLICDAEVEPITVTSPYGFDVYRSSLTFLLAKCAAKLFPRRAFRVHNSIGPALYCTVDLEDPSPANVSKAVAALRAELDALVARNVSITTEAFSYKGAVDIFGRLGRLDELHLLKHRNPPVVLLSKCEDFYALNQVTLAAKTGALALYDLIPHADGFILNVPSPESPDALAPLPPVEPYFKVFKEHVAWGRIMGITTIGELNEAILDKKFDDFVRTAETLQAKKLSQIADQITLRRPQVRLVLIAGPSSAGKTTTAKRLCIQLRVNGLRPLLVSTDNYFVGDAKNPRDALGRLDYENIAAVDQDRLNSDLNALFAGKSVHLRRFDFKKKAGYDAEDVSRLPPNGLVVVEGIHALNPELTSGTPDNLKFRIYSNALTQLVVDSCNRISTKDTRLLRRLVRDFQFRKQSPISTIRMWPSVAAGEREWIYPYQHLADAVFNSALDYELAVLKPYAVQLLNQVKPWDREFLEARRLSGILHNVSIAGPDAVPGDSILRETIGGSQLAY